MTARTRSSGPNSIYMAPDRPAATLNDLTALVRVPGRPGMVRAFTAAELERGEAAQYAAKHDGIVVSLAAHRDAS